MRFHSIAALLLLAVLLGCGTPGMPLPPSLELPEIVQDLRASRKGDVVSLVWTIPRQTTDQTTLRVRHLGKTRVCRSLQVGMAECSDEVGGVDTAKLLAAAEAAERTKSSAAGGASRQPQAASTKLAPVPANFQDRLPTALEQENPTGFVTYAVEILNTRGRSAGLSNQVQVPLAPTSPPPTDLSGKVTADGVVLTFTGALDEPEAPLRHTYRIYRQERGGAAPVLVGEVQLTTSVEGTLVDHSFEWQKTYEYRLAVVTVVQRDGRRVAEVEGDNSAPITVVANDVFPPAVPGGLQAVFSGVGQQPFVDLTWAPNTDPDLAGYNVYRREGNAPWTRLNSSLVLTPSYRDSNVAAGRTYLYAITAVDIHGNESARSPAAEEALPGSQ